MINVQADWETPAGRLLKQLCAAMPVPVTIVVYGSAPLQMCVEPSLLSQDVDIYGEEAIRDTVAREKLGVECRETGIQIGYDINFQAPPNWWSRALIQQVGHCRVVIPHPYDILVAKLHRAEPKDIEAFRLVIQKTGHPTEIELIQLLQSSVDMYQPGFDEEKRGDLKSNTMLVWEEIYGRRIDVSVEIITPALERRKQGWGHDMPDEDYKSQLRKL